MTTKTETVANIALEKLVPFRDHPFQVRDDEQMQMITESIRSVGVLVPAIARPLENGTYELIAGHRRKHACELAGLSTLPVIVRDVDRDTATVMMVDSNFQREEILPSERAKAYKMKLDAIKLLGLIPIVGQLAVIVIYCVILFGSETAPSVKNRMIATLIWVVIGLVIGGLLLGIFGVAAITAFAQSIGE